MKIVLRQFKLIVSKRFVRFVRKVLFSMKINIVIKSSLLIVLTVFINNSAVPETLSIIKFIPILKEMVVISAT